MADRKKRKIANSAHWVYNKAADIDWEEMELTEKKALAWGAGTRACKGSVSTT